MSLLALAAPALLLYLAATLGRRLILAVLLLVAIPSLAIAGVALVLLR
jgi:hypothetical protein